METTRTVTRRRALHLMGGAALAAVSAVRFANEVSAGRGWCRADPVLRVAGQKVHVYISSPGEMLRSANGKIRLIVTLPSGVEGKLIDILADFDEGYDVDFVTSRALAVEDGRVPMRVSVYCPARDGSLPVLVEVEPVRSGPLSAASASGTANDWITLRAG